MELTELELWNGHAWALQQHVKPIGPMHPDYDDYSAAADLRALSMAIQHAEWLKANLEQRFPGAGDVELR
jgi:uncharacterized protein (DUF2126 family)